MSDYQYRVYEKPKYNIGITEVLIIINVIFFLPYLVYFFSHNDYLLNIESIMFGLNINMPNVMSIENGAFWQIVTAMFMHGSISHIFFNMYGLFLFGKPLEIRMGKGKFLSFYLVTGILANIASAFFYKFTSSDPVHLLGASGAVFGVLLGFGTFYPEIRLLLFFIIPLKAKWAVLLYAGIELVSEVTGQASGISHITHLFGFVFGFLYLLIFFKINAIKEMFFTNRNYY